VVFLYPNLSKEIAQVINKSGVSVSLEEHLITFIHCLLPVPGPAACAQFLPIDLILIKAPFSLCIWSL